MAEPKAPGSGKVRTRPPGDRQPNLVDRHVGERVRARRKQLGLSQDRLAEALGLTFQQVQKYERGANRISASKLFDAAGALQVEISFFFDGLTRNADQPGVAEPEAPAFQHLALTSEDTELVEAFHAIGRKRLRKRIYELVREIAAEESASGVTE
jgi:transcriptional regulator with XRE-family HTH domain